MRLFALCLAVLVPAAASAQTVASSVQAAQVLVQDAPIEDRLDVLPAVAVDGIAIAAGAIGLAAATCIIVTQVTKEEGEENPTLSQTLIAGAVCGGLVGAWFCVNSRYSREAGIHAASGAVYDAGAIAAFAADALNSEEQASLAASARGAGRAGVVLQRVVERRAGVGGSSGQLVLEVAVVDAEMGTLRRFGNDALLPQTVASVPVDEDLSSARAEALASFTR